MEFQVGRNRIFAEGEDGSLLAEVTFPFRPGHRAEINHVFVDDALRGQGVASRLMETAYDHLKRHRRMVIATCPYAISWFAKHPDKQDILAQPVSPTQP
ncbi:MAG TPA: GNAT family N-acetyltransferase [Candidatus Izemoplasmatales bacterium]|nr:GNAT family N-acetyltransferase [Bacillota bacterium]HRY78406.1 GNAT family N-acetyltransferase [Candidatus Izemoplasmatales bacterium]